MLRAGIVGHRGYSGAELVRILERHPGVEPVLLEHREDAAAHPRFRGQKRPRQIACKPEAVRSEEIAVVFLATLPPQNPDGKNGHHAGLLPELNDQIARTAADEGAILVDLYRELGTWRGYIGADGLHPTAEGYQRIAEIWRDAIQEQFEKGGGASGLPAPQLTLAIPGR